jgi:hypothetical protein
MNAPDGHGQTVLTFAPEPPAIDRIEWAQADEPAIGILERMQSNDINQMPVLRDGVMLL